MLNAKYYLGELIEYVSSYFFVNDASQDITEFKKKLKTDIQLKAYELKAGNLSLSFKFESQIKALELAVPVETALKYKNLYQIKALGSMQDDCAALKIDTDIKLSALYMMLDKGLLRYHPLQCMNVEPITHFETDVQLELLDKGFDVPLIANLNPYSYFMIKKFNTYEPWIAKFDNPNQLIAALFSQNVEEALSIDTPQKLFKLYAKCELNNECMNHIPLKLKHIPQDGELELYQDDFTFEALAN